MKINRVWGLIALIFIISLSIRLYFAFENPGFVGDESYFSLRQVEHITDTGFPMIYDDLSYGGRIHLISPLFYYLLALFNLFLPLTIVAKVVPNLLANLVIPATFMIVYHLTARWRIATLVAAFSSFIPIFFTNTVYSVTPLSLFFSLTLFLIYTFLHVNKGKSYARYYVILLFLLSLTHVSIYVIIFALAIYTGMLRLEKLKQSAAELELILFSLLLSFWTQFIIYKKAFLTYGFGIFLQNIPVLVQNTYFQQITLLDSINQIGLIPLLAGVYVLYRYTLSEKKRGLYLIFSFILILAMMLFFRLLPLDFILIFIGLLLLILFSQFLHDSVVYIENTRFGFLRPYFLWAVVAFFLLTSVVGSFYYVTDLSENSKDIDESIEWLATIATPEEKILAPHIIGNKIMYEAGIQTVADTNFLLVNNIDSLFEDMSAIYTTRLETQALELIGKHDIDYIMTIYNSTDVIESSSLAYQNSICFKEVFNNRVVSVHKPICTFRGQEE